MQPGCVRLGVGGCVWSPFLFHLAPTRVPHLSPGLTVGVDPPVKFVFDLSLVISAISNVTCSQSYMSHRNCLLASGAHCCERSERFSAWCWQLWQCQQPRVPWFQTRPGSAWCPSVEASEWNLTNILQRTTKQSCYRRSVCSTLNLILNMNMYRTLMHSRAMIREFRKQSKKSPSCIANVAAHHSFVVV